MNYATQQTGFRNVVALATVLFALVLTGAGCTIYGVSEQSAPVQSTAEEATVAVVVESGDVLHVDNDAVVLTRPPYTEVMRIQAQVPRHPQWWATHEAVIWIDVSAVGEQVSAYYPESNTTEALYRTSQDISSVTTSANGRALLIQEGQELFYVDVVSQQTQRLSSSMQSAGFSPDGNTLVVEDAGGMVVYTLDADGAIGATVVVSESEEDTAPAFTSDDTLVFVRRVDENSVEFVEMNLVTATLQQRALVEGLDSQQIQSMSSSPSGERVLLQRDDVPYVVLDLSTQERVYDGPSLQEQAVAFIDDTAIVVRTQHDPRFPEEIEDVSKRILATGKKESLLRKVIDPFRIR